MADVLTTCSTPPQYTVALTRTEAATVLIAVSQARHLGALPKFMRPTARQLVETMRELVTPEGTLMGELYDLLAPAADEDDADGRE